PCRTDVPDTVPDADDGGRCPGLRSGPVEPAIARAGRDPRAVRPAEAPARPAPATGQPRPVRPGPRAWLALVASAASAAGLPHQRFGYRPAHPQRLGADRPAARGRAAESTLPGRARR